MKQQHQTVGARVQNSNFQVAAHGLGMNEALILGHTPTPWLMWIRVYTICKTLEILKGPSISLRFWLKIFGKLVSDLL
jgi:hypothetical protein